jgi:hypothetical protein
MSVERNFYVGPYAEWLVLPDEITKEFHQLVEGVLSTNSGMDQPPQVKVKRKLYHRFCFMPGQSRPGEPDWGPRSGDGAHDLRGVDMKAEIDWFATAFASEIASVADHLGRPPSFHWGVVAWMS